eukprot:6173710-Pleurochrysis_carterae.AAC.2
MESQTQGSQSDRTQEHREENCEGEADNCEDEADKYSRYAADTRVRACSKYSRQVHGGRRLELRAKACQKLLCS